MEALDRDELDERAWDVVAGLLGDELEIEPSEEVIDQADEALAALAADDVALTFLRRSANWSDDPDDLDAALADPDRDSRWDMWLDAAAAIVAPLHDPDDGPAAVLRHGDWIAITVGVRYVEVGEPVTPEMLFGCLELQRDLDEGEAREVDVALEAVCDWWQRLGALDANQGLTELGAWGISRSMLAAWDSAGLDDEELAAVQLAVLFDTWRERPEAVTEAHWHAAATIAWTQPDAVSLTESSAEWAAFSEQMYDVVGSTPAAAGAAYLAALHAEHRGDVIGQRDWIDRALAADPTHREALFGAAELAGAAGDAPSARDLLRRAEVDPSDTELAIYTRFARPPDRGPSRNAPCSCGSGRKYKLCCGARVGHPLNDRANWIWAKVCHFVQRPPQRRGLLSWAARANDSEGEITAEVVRTAMSDQLVWDAALFDGEMLDRFLETRAKLLPLDEQVVVASWRDTARSLYEVTAARPGTSITLTDLLNGETVEVRERTASREVHRGDLLLARVLPVADIFMLGAVAAVPRLHRASLLALLRETAEAEPLLDWFRSASAPPQLRTREGEEILYVTQEWRVDDAMWVRLGDRLEQADDGGLLELHDIGGEQIVRSRLHRDGDVVTMTTNSADRAERIATLLIDTGAALVSDERQTMDEMSHRPHAVPDPVEMTPSMLEAVEEIARMHERRWVEEEIPMFGGRRPRDMVDDADGRREVEAFLDDLIIDAERRPERAGVMDPHRIRELLGLPPRLR